MTRFLNTIFWLLGRFSARFPTFHLRPKYSTAVRLLQPQQTSQDDLVTGIVVQGPLILENRFSYETLKLYKRLFPASPIILSTWIDENPQELSAISALGIDVVLCNKPSYPGPANINLQIISTSEGVSRAKKVGCEYVLKTRTDQRIYSETCLHFCRSALSLFPLEGFTRQNYRIVAFNLNTFKYRLYGVSDMVNFGYIDDMISFWSPPLDHRDLRELTGASTLLEFSQQRFAEVYLVTNFLERIGREIHWTLEDSFCVIAQHFCILNVSDIDLYWPKYTAKEYRHRTYSVIRTAQFDFSDWLSYQACPPQDVPEYVININFDELDSMDFSSLALERERSKP